VGESIKHPNKIDLTNKIRSTHTTTTLLPMPDQPRLKPTTINSFTWNLWRCFSEM
jgi:hypothetical protein